MEQHDSFLFSNSDDGKNSIWRPGNCALVAVGLQYVHPGCGISFYHLAERQNIPDSNITVWEESYMEGDVEMDFQE